MENEKFMYNRRTPVKLLPCELVASKASPIIGATPDARDVDFGCTDHFGIAKIAKVKCPYTKQHVTPLEACTDENFFMEKISDTECKLKEDHTYCAQVQGQMAVTGARWGDFIVHTTRGLYVQRIPFNRDFWAELHQKLVSYYFNHFTPFAVHLRKIHIHLHQQLKLYGKYTFISTSMNFINANELSITLFAYVLTFYSINR